MMKSLILHRLVIIFLFWLPHCLLAQSQMEQSGVALSADRMISDKSFTRLKGDVQLVFKGTYLKADQATINWNTKSIEASGNVVLQNPEFYAEASELQLNYETKKGILENGFVQSGQVVFMGQTVKKIGEKKFVVIDGEFTACKTCPPAWSFSGSRIEAEIGGYADISYPAVRVGGVPTLILPRLILPLKSKRQSGLLVPQMELGTTSGLALAFPYFWAISRSQDFTGTLKYYAKRGLQGLGEYRYVLDKESYGQLRGGYLEDQLFQDTTDGAENRLNRGFVDYFHYFGLPNRFTQRMDINYVSDLRYLRDFSEQIKGHGDPAVESQFSLTKNSTTQHLSIDTSLHTNLLQANPLAGNQNAVHRFPEIRYSVAEQRIFDLPLLFSLDWNYVQFARNGFSYDDIKEHTSGDPCKPQRNGIDPPDKCVPLSSGPITERKVVRDGSFDDGDLIRAGHRFDLRQSLSLPFLVADGFDFMPAISYRETQYRFNSEATNPSNSYSPSAARRYLQTDLFMRTRFSKIFGDTQEERETLYRHEIEPEVQYSSIPWIRRPDHPFFGEFAGQPYSRSNEKVTDQDFFGDNKLQFDYKDRIFDKNLVRFVLTNRLIRKKWQGLDAKYQNVAQFRLSQSYDFEEAERKNPHPWSPIDSVLSLKLSQFDVLMSSSYFPYARISNFSGSLRLKSQTGNFIELLYRLEYILNEDQTEYKTNSRDENTGLGIGLVTRYFNLSGNVKYSPIEQQFQSWEYQTIVKPPGDCWAIIIGQQKEISSENIKTVIDFQFEFGGGS